MLQEYWASTVIFIGIFSQCIRDSRNSSVKFNELFFQCMSTVPVFF